MGNRKGRGWLWIFPIMIIAGAILFDFAYFSALIGGGAILAIFSTSLYESFIMSEIIPVVALTAIVVVILMVVWFYATKPRGD